MKPLDAITEGHIPGDMAGLIDSLFNESQARQVNAAYRFFGLITERGQPTEDLWRLQNREHRKPVLRELLLRHYAFVLPELEREDVSEEDIEAAFGDTFGISGTNVQSTVAFFVYLAQYAGLPLPPQLARIRGRTKLRNVPPDMQAEQPMDEMAKQIRFQAEVADQARQRERSSLRLSAPPPLTHSIRLPSGGQVILSVNVDWFRVGEDERAFLLSLIDNMRRYEHTLAQDQENDKEVDGG